MNNEPKFTPERFDGDGYALLMAVARLTLRRALNDPNSKKSREYLVRKGFLRQAETGDGKPLYVITDKGHVALRATRQGQRGVFDED